MVTWTNSKQRDCKMATRKNSSMWNSSLLKRELKAELQARPLLRLACQPRLKLRAACGGASMDDVPMTVRSHFV